MTYAELKRNVDIVAVIGRHVSLRRVGTEHKGHCPFHNDKKPSFTVNARKGVWACFVCGVGGDVIDFLKKRGMEHEQIVRELGGQVASSGERVAITQVAAAGTQVAGVRPARLWHPRLGEPSAVWEYHTAAGELWGLVCRFETAEGKQVLPFTCHGGASGGASGWKWAGFDEPRPLWNLPEMIARPDVPIIITEGEKAAAAAKALYKGAVASCWQGGTNAWRKSDWGVVAGRRVILWPDADEPGRKAMAEVAGHIAHACQVQMVDTEGLPAKWDVADADWTAAEAKEWLRGRLRAWEPAAVVVAPSEAMPSETIAAVNVDGEHFHVLGFVKDGNRISYAVYTLANKVVSIMSASALDKKGLLQLAPMDWWQAYFPAKKDYDYMSAFNWICRLGDARGVFNMNAIRGRGAWMDAGRVVLHAGTHLVVDGTLHQLGMLRTKFIYEQGAHLPMDAEEVMSDEEANELFKFVSSLNFARPLDAMLLAGWIALAPVCGMLRWRPHIWVTGAAGSGKSWILSHLIKDCIGDVSVFVQGETTEAGLRQAIGNDALPIVFDEAESESAGSSARVDGVLAFARAASTGEAGMVAKGGQGGKGHTYSVRTMLAMASILPAVTLKSDVGRFSVLEVLPDRTAGATERWAAQLELYNSIVASARGGRFVGRIVKNLPVLIGNIEAASIAAAEVLGDQRAGDQIGALLAGAFMWTTPTALSVADFRGWLRKQDLSSEREASGMKDEDTLLGLLLGAIIKVDGNHTRTVFELAEITTKRFRDDRVEYEMAKSTLERHGFRVDGDALFVSDSHHEVRRILAGTQFARNHARTLMRLEGALSIKSMRFAGAITRATKIQLYEQEKRLGEGSSAGPTSSTAAGAATAGLGAHAGGNSPAGRLDFNGSLAAEQAAGRGAADDSGHVPF
jgi:putative DNA primase/helicase